MPTPPPVFVAQPADPAYDPRNGYTFDQVLSLQNLLFHVVYGGDGNASHAITVPEMGGLTPVFITIAGVEGSLQKGQINITYYPQFGLLGTPAIVSGSSGLESATGVFDISAGTIDVGNIAASLLSNSNAFAAQVNNAFYSFEMVVIAGRF